MPDSYLTQLHLFLFFLFQVHPWTEFKLFSLGAVYDYTLDTGDLSLANETFANLVAHYSLSQFIQTSGHGPVATAGLVVKPPRAGLPAGVPSQAADDQRYYFQVYQDLVDYPDAVDVYNDDAAFPTGARCCLDDYVFSNVSTAINAHVAQAHRRLADMSRWLGHPTAEADRFGTLADGIVAGLKRQLQTTKCSPPAPACFLDGYGLPVAGSNRAQNASAVPINHTAVQATLFVVGCGDLLTPVEALVMLPFLKAKTEVMPLFSAMAANFMLEGLYRMAAADTTSAAADFAYDILSRDGHRSWREMLAANATMTTEHWYGTFTGTNGGHTWSHPWSAAPARLIPQWLLGVRPLERAWRRIAVHPQPGSTVTRATMTVPTLRGEVALSYARVAAGGAFGLNLTIPGNTDAEVCLPVGLLPEPASVFGQSPGGGVITVDGKAAATVVPADRPGHVCLASDLPGGSYVILAR